MDANAERMPGDAEAAGAAAGMAETYGRATHHAVGDSIWVSTTVGAMPRQTRVIEVGIHGFLIVQDEDGERYTITPAQIAEF